MRWRHTTDPWGRQVVLRPQEWRHVLGRHPETRPRQDAVLGVVLRPDVITPDPRARRWRYCGAGAVHTRWLFVVVDWREHPAKIVTAYGQRKGPI